MIQHGTAQSDGFILQEATLMLGAVGGAKDLTVEENSIGLFKNLQVQESKTFTDLTQGVRQSPVASALTEHRTMITGEGYEFTPRQLMYAMGQEGYLYQHSTPVITTLSTAATTGTDTITVTAATGFAVNDYLIIQPSAGVDNGLAYKITAVATNTITLDRDLVEAFPAGSKVYKSVLIKSSDSFNDSCSGAVYMSAKIVSQKQNCEPIILTAEKVRVSSGLSLSFGSSDFSNIPYELTLMELTPRDTGYDDWIAAGGNQYEILTP